MHSEARALYYKLYESYLTRNQDLTCYYELLVDSYSSNPESFSTFSKKELLRIKMVQDDLKNNRWSLFSSPLDLSCSIPEALKREKSQEKHKDLCTRIAKNYSNTLEQFIGPIDYMDFEYETGYGPADIIIFGQNRTCYIVEVKTSAADHSIVGQVMKYFIGMSLKLNLRLFDDVTPISVCPGYDKASYEGLKSLGAITALISQNPFSTSEI